jgi:lipoic acid synthetase
MTGERSAPAASRLPPWLRKSLAAGRAAADTDALIRDLGLETICQSGRCPNRNECWSQKTATFMILGDRCTRSCSYCSVPTGRGPEVDPTEPERLARAAARLGLRHVVVTSVTRDDLPDEGAGHFREVVLRLKAGDPSLIVEVLTPDFRRTQPAAAAALSALPIDIFNHNVETVERLHRRIRPQGGYALSLGLLRRMADARRGPRPVLKSGAMLGLGETREEVLRLLADLRAAGCEMLTLGQYLRSHDAGAPVARFVPPEEFEEFRQIGYNMGFYLVESGPFVRSSYHAKGSFDRLQERLEGTEIRA